MRRRGAETERKMINGKENVVLRLRFRTGSIPKSSEEAMDLQL